MRTSRNYYEILGLPRNASSAQIKRKYKELVRKYHPDVAKDKKMAHQLFIQITEAYQVLSNTEQRKSYDASLNSFASSSAQSTRSTTTSSSQSGSYDEAAQLLKDAQWSYIQRRFNDAARFCKESIRMNPGNAKAYGVLGDIYRAQNKVNGAVNAYSMALQYNPNDREVEKKLTDLIGKRISHDNTLRAAPPSNAKLIVLNMIGWTFVIFLIMLIGVMPGKPIPWLKYYIPQVAGWSWNMVGLMAAASVVAGILLAAGGFIRHPDEELVLQGTAGEWAMVPTGILLLLGSGFFFLGAAAFYMVVGLIQSSISRSVMIVFAGVIGVVLLTAIVFQSAGKQVLLFGGNVAFLSAMIGWYIGSMFRPLDE